MANALWPPLDLRLRTGDLELRLPNDDDIAALAALARAGVHPPEEMPFAVPWTDVDGAEFDRNFVRFRWHQRTNIEPHEWTLDFAVFVGGEPAGCQDIGATNFAVLQTVRTGSWLGRGFQGRGVGRLMRQAVLSLAFDHLGAEIAESGAFVDNPASARVSAAIGYEPNGIDRVAPRGVARDMQRYRLTLETWRSRPRPTVEVEGLEACREMLGMRAAG
ncbi:MAG TPA: GNAT family protein [Candidatus Limnocylindrales bacterium]|nr:GNAT family protein [Candidatus Limnocylindrales bacterium]